jgi:hypothetical protein
MALFQIHRSVGSPGFQLNIYNVSEDIILKQASNHCDQLQQNQRQVAF